MSAANDSAVALERHAVKAGGRIVGALLYDARGELTARMHVIGYDFVVRVDGDEATHNGRAVAHRYSGRIAESEGAWRTVEADARGTNLLAVLDTWDFERASRARAKPSRRAGDETAHYRCEG